MGRCDKRELAVVCPAPDGQTQLAGSPAQRDEALLHLREDKTGTNSGEEAGQRAGARSHDDAPVT